MTDTSCGYPGDRDTALVGYLYDDINPIERASFESHLSACQCCRAELDQLRGVRMQLVHWAPPEPARRSGGAAAAARRPRWAQTLSNIPAWAQMAAALLFFGVAAGVANLDVRYDDRGLSVRTGWSRQPASTGAAVAQDSRADAQRGLSPAASPAKTGAAGNSGAAPGGAAQAALAGAPWRADLVALEQQLRNEFHASAAGAPALATVAGRTVPAATGAPDAETIRRVRALIDESERRQQRELALRVAQVVRDVDVQRRADLVRIDRSLGLIQNNTGVEVMKQRELLNYLMRVSQKQ